MNKSQLNIISMILLLIKLFSEQLSDEYLVRVKIVTARIKTQTADVNKIVRSLSLEKKFQSNCRFDVVPSREDEFPLDGVPPPPLRLIIIY